MPAAYVRKRPLSHPIQIRLKVLGKTQKWLAGQAGYSEHTISAVANGLCYPRAGSILAIRIKKALGVDQNYLMGMSKQLDKDRKALQQPLRMRK